MEAEKNETDGGIRNRVEESGLVQIDLDMIRTIPCVELNFTKWLWEGVVVKEKEFRAHIAEIDVSEFEGVGVGLSCTEDAIVPDWVWMLLSSKLSCAEFVVVGGIASAEIEALRRAIEGLQVDEYRDKRIVVRGCANSGGVEALVQIQQKLQPIVKGLMFGEACSTVPVYKKSQLKK